MSMSSTVVGVQLGNSLAKICLLKGAPEVIANEDGDRNLSVCITHLPETSEFLCGKKSGSNASTFSGFFLDFVNDRSQAFTLGESGKIDTRDLCLRFLRRLSEIARAVAGRDADCVVVSLSGALFGSGSGALRLQSLISAAFAPCAKISLVSQAAGSLFSVAASAPSSTSRRVFVLELGGSSSTLSSALLLNEQILTETPEISRISSFSGELVDCKLQGYVRDVLLKKQFPALELSGRMSQKLASACQEAKKALSQSTSVNICLESFWEGSDFSCTIQRSRFEMLIDPLIRSLLEDLGQAISADDSLLVVGCTSRIPCVARRIREEFPKAEIAADPESISVKGACLLGKLLNACTAGVGAKELIVPKSLYFTIGGDKLPLVQSGTAFPFSRKISLPGTRESQAFAVKEEDSAVVEGTGLPLGDERLGVSVDGEILENGATRIIMRIIANDGEREVCRAEF